MLEGNHGDMLSIIDSDLMLLCVAPNGYVYETKILVRNAIGND